MERVGVCDGEKRLEFDARDELDWVVSFVRDLLWILPLTYFGFYSSGAWVS